MVWGGDPDHGHAWDLAVPPTSRTGGTAASGLGAYNDKSPEGVQRSLERQSHPGQGSAFCGCGAWLGQLGLEPTPELYVEHLVDVFREVRRVLRDDGTLWLNLGDCYASAGGAGMQGKNGQRNGERAPFEEMASAVRHRGYRGARLANTNGGDATRPKTEGHRGRRQVGDTKNPNANIPEWGPNRAALEGLKPKDLVGIPWFTAFALRADGWWLRRDIIWHKPNPMPESVEDRCTTTHEYLFHLSKSERYYYDAEAIKERAAWPDGPNAPDAVKSPYGQGFTRRARRSGNLERKPRPGPEGHPSHLPGNVPWEDDGTGRNKRSVWTVATVPYAEAHFATFPPALVEPCVLAGTSERGCCPYCGAGWVRQVERTAMEFRHSEREAEKHAQGLVTALHGTLLRPAETKTVGWAPGCKCVEVREGIAGVADPAMPLVLDPFAGSGTVGEVCHRLGRRFVGLELAADYLGMAKARTAQMGLL